MSSPSSDLRGSLTPASFAERFREHSRVLWCVAAGVLGERSHAEDVLQEAALAALGKLGTFREGSSFVAWMSQYVRFVALNHRRKQTRRQRSLDAQPLPAAQGDPGPPPGSGELFDARVREALASLSEMQRTCLLLKTVVELEYGEIAELLEIPPGTAMSHVSRARARMQRLLPRPAAALSTEVVR